MEKGVNKRKEKDVMKLLVSEYEVDVQGDSTSEFFVKFNGPKDSPYENVRPPSSHARRESGECTSACPRTTRTSRPPSDS